MKLSKLAAVAASCLLAGAALAVPVQWTVASGGNDHWYEYVDDNVNWPTAFVAANASSFMGMQGYLATITSDAENIFASFIVAGGDQVAWLGGSDDGDGNEGVWSWRNGPEAGQVFWNNGATLIYANWNPSEPNNCCGGENFLQTNFATPMGWNDHGGPGNPQQLNGYVIEYSGAAVALPVSGTAWLAAVPLLVAAGARRRRS